MIVSLVSKFHSDVVIIVENCEVVRYTFLLERGDIRNVELDGQSLGDVNCPDGCTSEAVEAVLFTGK